MTDTGLRPYAPADHDWLVDAHQRLYRAAEGFDDTFGPLVSDILTAFENAEDTERQAGWIAQDVAGPVGSVFCVPASATRAKLRLFLLLPRARGTGLAATMLETCLQFARDKGFDDMQLWTHRSHVAAGKLYARHGFDLVGEVPVTSFGVPLIEQTWHRRL